MPKKKGPLGQPEVNIGLIGHVDHGKTTLTEQLSGKWTDTHSEELKRGITIRLGYADSVFYKCPKCKGDIAFSIKPKCPRCSSDAKPFRKVSFIDAPGHESLMATMLSGANIMDGALLLVAADEPCPQPQTQEHVVALEIIGVEKLIVVQNKIDLVNKEAALNNYKEIKEFLKGTKFRNAPIIPVSAQYGVNIDVLIKAINSVIKTPKRDSKKEPLMLVARSFDINKPGSDFSGMVGGVIGGALKQGVIKIGEEIEILPGYEVEERNQKVWKPLDTKVTGMMTGGEKVKEVGPGGSIALLTELDPSIVKSDKLSGALVGHKGKMPPVWYEFSLEVQLLERVVGSKDKLVVDPIKPNEALMLNVNSAATVGFVISFSKGIVACKLKIPVCAEPESRVTISRRFGNRWRLIGYGVISQ